MSVIRQEDLITSIADALQYISYYHPPDFIRAMREAWEREQSPAAKDAIAQILRNARMAALGRRPMCQDTGIVSIFLEIGMDVRWAGATVGPEEMVNEGVRRAWQVEKNPLRASIVTDPAGARRNTGDNAPAVIHTRLVPGGKLGIDVMARGGGGEAKARYAMLNPSASVSDWVVRTVPGMGAGWCPPGILGIGIGGTPAKAMELAEQALVEPIDIQALRARGAANRIEELRLELYEKVNALGIGAQGLGGLTTVLDVKIRDYPTHAALLPVAIVPNCAATRHVGFVLDGGGPVDLAPPDLSNWPEIAATGPGSARRVSVNDVTRDDLTSWRAGETLLLSGMILTARDAAHQRLSAMLVRGEKLPVDFTNRFLYYVGPVPAAPGEIIGPAGPTTARRMDKFTRQMLEQTDVIAMIGKAERGADAIAAIKDNCAVYLIAVGGAAYLIAKAIQRAHVVAFADLGMEAIYELEVKDMPVTVAVDAKGKSVHQSGPREWCAKIGKMPLDLLEVAAEAPAAG
ncbi:MAG: fumarate hydratase [Acetobacteraceae bacterium]